VYLMVLGPFVIACVLGVVLILGGHWLRLLWAAARTSRARRRRGRG
jgi:hypothetical protein